MKGDVMIKDVYKDIENIVNKDKIDQEFLDRTNMRKNPLTNIGNFFDDEPDDRECFTFGAFFFSTLITWNL